MAPRDGHCIRQPNFGAPAVRAAEHNVVKAGELAYRMPVLGLGPLVVAPECCNSSSRCNGVEKSKMGFSDAITIFLWS